MIKVIESGIKIRKKKTKQIPTLTTSTTPPNLEETIEFSNSNDYELNEKIKFEKNFFLCNKRWPPKNELLKSIVPKNEPISFL